jgi:hypothetical protein
VLCTGHLSELIEAFVGGGFGMQVCYSVECERLLGTPARCARHCRCSAPNFWLLMAIAILTLHLRPVVEAFRQSSCTGLMTVVHNAGRWDTSNVEWDGNRILEYSKTPTSRMMHIDYGLTALKACAFDSAAPSDPLDLEAIYGALAAAGNLAGYCVTQRFYEIGSVAGLVETEAYFCTKNGGAG